LIEDHAGIRKIAVLASAEFVESILRPAPARGHQFIDRTIAIRVGTRASELRHAVDIPCLIKNQVAQVGSVAKSIVSRETVNHSF
jgi:hypothetical protein